MLANWQTENIVGTRQRNAVAGVKENQAVSRARRKRETDMAVLGEMTIFSLRTNCWNSFELRTGARSEGET